MMSPTLGLFAAQLGDPLLDLFAWLFATQVALMELTFRVMERMMCSDGKGYIFKFQCVHTCRLLVSFHTCRHEA
jgi:hypothetical protein